jgi:predicted ATPase
MITTLAISGYRSLRDVRLPLGPLNVVTGANGSGKSSLYRALSLLADIAHNRALQSLATEGGLSSTLWAGPEKFSRAMKSGDQPVQGLARKNPVSLKLGFASADHGYAIDLGLPVPNRSAFDFDPQVKVESLWIGQKLSRASIIAERNGASVRIRDDSGAWRQIMAQLSPFDSMMAQCSDPKGALELFLLRETMRDWRFYDHLRTDRDAPARKRRAGVYTPVLSGDGADLAAAIQTINEIGAAAELDETIEDAFPGAALEVHCGREFFELSMRQHGLLRALATSELSDGTLRFLLLSAALLSPRPPKLMILNEPETSLHVDLLPALARLIARASRRSQMIVVSHAIPLVETLSAQPYCTRITLHKEFGETRIDAEPPPWAWPTR